MNERIEEMWNDPRFQLLSDVEHLLNSSKIWAGMEYTYLPIHPVKYCPIEKKVREALDALKKEYGIEE